MSENTDLTPEELEPRTFCGPLCDRNHNVDEPHNRNFAPVQPQDHQRKAGGPFTFVGADGQTYTLPEVTEEVGDIVPGEATYAVIMNPTDEAAQMRLGFLTLEACKPDPAALAALKGLSAKKMIETLGEWMGESSGSSV